MFIKAWRNEALWIVYSNKINAVAFEIKVGNILN
jgi:hypothetical protein